MPFMLPTILKNLFTPYATRLYPFEKREAAQGARGHIEFIKSKCVYCGSCMRKCPSVAIEVDMKKRELTFYAGRCIVCNACVEACPKDAITLERQWGKPFDRPPVETFRQEGAPEKAKPPAGEKKAEAAPAKAEEPPVKVEDAAAKVKEAPAVKAEEVPAGENKPGESAQKAEGA